MSDLLPPGYKRCTGCQDVKRLWDFHKNSRSKDGRMPSCKACRAISGKLYRFRPDVAAHRAELRREYIKRPEIREWINWGQKLRRLENP
jgi:NAD-dependent SIR2 family protein deacetylase